MRNNAHKIKRLAVYLDNGRNNLFAYALVLFFRNYAQAAKLIAGGMFSNSSEAQ
jgi:hypothetical protein